MKTNLLLVLTLFLSVLGFSQTIVINEFDTQTPGQDYEEFVELRSEMPNTPLDGYVLVFFNGSASGDDRSYFTLDLDGTTTDINGLLLIGSTGVSPIPDVIVPPAFIQNGADAVKLQTYTPETMTINSNKKYFRIKDGLWKGYTLWDLYKKAHTPLEWHRPLFDYAKKLKIKIFSTPFDESAVDFLENLKCPIYKVASFEATVNVTLQIGLFFLKLFFNCHIFVD